MLDAAHAAHLLAAAGAAGAAVDEDGQRRAVAGRFGGVGAVDDQHPAVIGAGAEHEVARRVGRMGEQRQRQAAHAAVGERDGVVEVAVGHDRRDRPERLDVVDRVGAPGIVGAQQDRREEGAAAVTGDWRRDRPRRSARRGFQLGDPAADVVALRAADQRAHPRTPSSRGSPTLVLAQPLARAPARPRRDAAAGAMARRIAVHFCPALTVISVATSLTNRSNSGVPGAASGPSSEALRLSLLGDEADDLARDHRVRLELHRGRRRAGEADHVLARSDGRTGRRRRRRSAAARPAAAGPLRS